MDRYVGIDVSKNTLDVAILAVDGEIKHLKVTNDASGNQELVAALKGLSCHVILEATGTYHRHVQQALQDALVAVSVVNPRQALMCQEPEQTQ